jgi:predicted metal-binding membrane protein
MDNAFAPFLGTWTLMMAAMMLPSAMPMILLHRRAFAARPPIRSEVRTGIFVATYLLVWGAAGIVVWIGALVAGALLPMEARPFAVAGVLLLAGIYQLTPLKSACLRVCRSPMDFLLTHWRSGLAGEVRLGVEHGLYCLGCCWALMLVFVAAFAMGLLWAAIIALAVLVEKVLPWGVVFSRAVAVVLIAGAVLVVFRPDIVQPMSGTM